MSGRTRTEAWLRQFIIADDICPFAHLPFRQGLLRITEPEVSTEEGFTQVLLQELLYLYEHPRTELETSLLLASMLFTDFEDFWAYTEWVQEELLVQANLAGIFQVVAFHPDFRFADSKGPQDPADFVNRSPVPLLHLLREESVTEAQANHPDIDTIPARNAAKLRQRSFVSLVNSLQAY